VIDDLIARYDESAVVTVRPYVDGSGETLRWIVEVDGAEIHDLDVRVRSDPDRPEVMVMLLVHMGKELEIERWSTTKTPYGPGAVVRTLGGLARAQL
jgi:hypothetical protein